MAGASERPDPKPVAPRHSGELGLLPDSDILAMVTRLTTEPLRGVIAEGGLHRQELVKLRAGLARPRSLRRPLHPLLRRDTPLLRLQVADYRSKDSAVAHIGSWAKRQGLGRRGIASLEQATDELLLNALFDAPHDAEGRPRAGGLPLAERLQARAAPGQQATLCFAADAERLVVAVGDRFGTLRRETILRYLLRCAEAQRLRQSPLEPKGSGAGVGLYLVAGVASELLFRLRRGLSTEVVFVVYRQPSQSLRALLIDED
jgi:anti-sigma regulatory factor (Ser/Thr protein kinase)